MNCDGLPQCDRRYCLTVAEDVAHIYRTLLHRSPENAVLGVGKPAIDFALSVATSDERRALLEREFRENQAASSDLWATNGRSGYLISYTADKVIGEAIRSNGYFEEEAIGYAVQFMADLGRPVRLTTFVDVGANIGTHILWALRSGFQNAVCIEADADNFKLLRVNQILNDIDARCKNIQVAASAEDSTGWMELSPTNFGDHRVRDTSTESLADLHGERQRRTRAVSTRRLDSILADVDVDLTEIGMVWIDTQGHEGHVLAGAPSLIVDLAVPIVAEFWPYGLERSGGYRILRDLLATSKRQIYDLRQCIKTSNLKALELTQIDDLYANFLSRESADASPHTDLLLV